MNQHLALPTYPQILFGINASPGIVIGRILLIDQASTPINRFHIQESEVEMEVRRFENAVEGIRNELIQIRGELTGLLKDYSSIIDSHILILQDNMIYQQTRDFIRDLRVNAEWALEQALQKIKAVFAKIDDTYIRTRFQDVVQVAEKIQYLLSGGQGNKFFQANSGAIVVARDFSPADATQMQARHILGFLSEMGGKTSHTAIVARAFGIPAVVGLESITRKVSTGDVIILDGIAGKVIIHPTPDQIEHYLEYQRQYEQYNEELAYFAHLPAETMDGLKIRVLANIEMLEEIPAALQYGASGIGLYRSEYFYIGRKTLPDEETIFSVYRDLLTLMAPYPVTIRTLDVGGEKIGSVFACPRETNPALGVRAIRFSLYEEELFAAQLRAIFRASVFGTLRLMFPMITDVREIIRVKEIVGVVRAELKKKEIAFAEKIEIGIMIEVPSAVSLADVLAEEVDFFSIGTNDLIQYALAIDRGNEQVAHMYEPLHPAVLRMIRQVVEAGHGKGIDVGLCGEMAGDPSYTPVLLGLGIDELSMNPLAVPAIKRMIRNSTAQEVEELTETLLTFSTAEEIRQHLSTYLPRRYPEEFGNGMPVYGQLNKNGIQESGVRIQNQK